jgi:peptidyl-prolyl cis-trans isomerase C
MDVKNVTLGAVLGLFLAVPAVAQDAAGAESAAPSIDTVVATVGGTDITLGHMIAVRAQLPQQYQQLPDEALFEGILAQLVNQEALSRQADGASNRVELTLDNERRAMLANAVLAKVVAEAVSEEAIEQAYQDNFASAEPETEWNASHILLETEDDAKEVKAELDAGADFADLAREKSTGPTGPNGGSLGWFGPGMMLPEFEEAVKTLEPGAISEPFQTQYGWHVAKLNETREQQPPTLEEAHDQLAAQLQQEAVEAAMAAATDEVEVVRPDISGIDPNVLSDSALID